LEIRDFSRAPPGPSSEENPSKAYVFLLRQRSACGCKRLEIQQAKPGNGLMEEGGLPVRGAWSLRSAPLGAWTSCCFRSRGKPPNPRLRCARPGRCARLLLARGSRNVFVVGGNPEPPFRCARPGRCARLLLARGRHVVFEVGGNPRTPVSAALGLIAAMDFFGMLGCMACSVDCLRPCPRALVTLSARASFAWSDHASVARRGTRRRCHRDSFDCAVRTHQCSQKRNA
jgi:hypothetical protein